MHSPSLNDVVISSVVESMEFVVVSSADNKLMQCFQECNTLKLHSTAVSPQRSRSCSEKLLDFEADVHKDHVGSHGRTRKELDYSCVQC